MPDNMAPGSRGHRPCYRTSVCNARQSHTCGVIWNMLGGHLHGGLNACLSGVGGYVLKVLHCLCRHPVCVESNWYELLPGNAYEIGGA